MSTQKKSKGKRVFQMPVDRTWRFDVSNCFHVKGSNLLKISASALVTEECAYTLALHILSKSDWSTLSKLSELSDLMHTIGSELGKRKGQDIVVLKKNLCMWRGMGTTISLPVS